jgi:hypothetical protein
VNVPSGCPTRGGHWEHSVVFDLLLGTEATVVEDLDRIAEEWQIDKA